MIRYVDSAGWTWEVCELADRKSADSPLPTAPAWPPAVSAPAVGAHPLLADVADRGASDPPADALSDLSSMGQLYFFSRLGSRKLRDYPATWTQLSRTGLEALCARAQDLGAAAAT